MRRRATSAASLPTLNCDDRERRETKPLDGADPRARHVAPLALGVVALAALALGAWSLPVPVQGKMRGFRHVVRVEPGGEEPVTEKPGTEEPVEAELIWEEPDGMELVLAEEPLRMEPVWEAPSREDPAREEAVRERRKKKKRRKRIKPKQEKTKGEEGDDDHADGPDAAEPAAAQGVLSPPVHMGSAGCDEALRGIVRCDPVGVTTFCGTCQYRNEEISCDDKLRRAVEERGVDAEEWKNLHLKHCHNTAGCIEQMRGYARCEGSTDGPT